MFIDLATSIHGSDVDCLRVTVYGEQDPPATDARLPEIALPCQSLGESGVEWVRCQGFDSFSEPLFGGSIDAIQSLDDGCGQPDRKTHKPR